MHLQDSTILSADFRMSMDSRVRNPRFADIWPVLGSEAFIPFTADPGEVAEVD